MDRTNKSLLLDKISQEYFTRDSTREVYVPVSESEFHQVIPLLPEINVVLIGLFGVENFADSPGFTLLYVLEKRDCRNFVILQRRLPGNEASSIAEHFPSACWFEREVRDGLGIEFPDAFDKRRLFLHEAYPHSFHPLRKSFRNQDVRQIFEPSTPGDFYLFKEVNGAGVYQVPVGPVHAGIIEPGHFRFSVIGETIFNLEVRLFYKHRGIEKLAEGKSPEQGVTIAETISGDETAANAVAFCRALETVSGITLPDRAWSLRTVLLELERVHSHLADLAGMIVDVAFPVGAAEFHILREEIFRYNQMLTGSRFLKNIICPGGLKQDLPANALKALSSYLNAFLKRFEKAVSLVHRMDSVIDRLETTGVIRQELVNPLNLTGPTARASGVNIDNRLDHPYGVYPEMGITPRIAARGDVLARFDVKALEIMDSISLIQKLIGGLPGGCVCLPCKPEDGCALSIVEAPRGQNMHWVYVKQGLIHRYKVRTASFCNWQAIEHAVIGNIVPDFPLINKSLNLSYAGTDL